MEKKTGRREQFATYLTRAILIALAAFVLYIIVAAAAVIWLKVILAIAIILISIGCLVLLYLSQELLRKRSLWMSAAAAGLFLCTVMSLILNYPSPV